MQTGAGDVATYCSTLSSRSTSLPFISCSAHTQFSKQPVYVQPKDLMTMPVAAGHYTVQQTVSALFFATLVIALVPFTYMCVF